MSSRPVRIATRASQLALWQAHHIADRLREVEPGLVVEIVEVSTAGDRNQVDRLRTMGNTGVFTREVQAALLDGRADVAVHSLKDLPTDMVEGLCLAAVPARAPEFDVLVLPTGKTGENGLLDLPHEARVGTGSPRRQAQLRFHRPDLNVEEIRGNVDTRLRKLDDGEYDAILLAAAGLTRLGWGHRISVPLQPPVMYPAVGQGALGIESGVDDAWVREILSRLTDNATLAAVTAERSLLATLRAGCHAPLGVTTRIDGQSLQLEAVLLRPDGSARWTAAATGSVCDAARVGESVARLLVEQGAAAVL
jgi:hydroxymethylbilane synthase